ncbi:MAG: polar amino acid ABC transporter permease [Herpetosiphonaceae bacterium]|nr:MAG: polar amino acid ABC transporter permease [Herpetosiphonaceae bacterium]
MSSTDVQVTQEVKQPRVAVSLIDWLRRNLFSNWLNSIITLLLLWVIVSALVRLFDWALTEATWTPVVKNLRLFMVGRYPGEAIWRVQVALALVLALFGISGGIWGGITRKVTSGLVAATILLAILPLSMGTRLYFVGMAVLMALGFIAGLRFPRLLRWPAIALWIISPIVIVILIGGISGLLPSVDTSLWGGLMLTLMLAVVGIVASFPIGVLLALGRRSKLPVVKGFCVAYIETIRGVPLVTVLFMASIMLPLFLPAQIRIADVVRAMVALTLFSAAYLAENVRGGLQAVPNGQIEAARSLGLNVFQTTTLILLPQALRMVIPAIVGQFISLFKDTSLAVVVGLTELLGIAEVVIRQPDWLTVPGGVQREVLLFVALIYWVFSFSMARVSYQIERRLGVGTR